MVLQFYIKALTAKYFINILENYFFTGIKMF
nr:MAG TPA: hypothetical protein [Bacteriophage sp.]